MCEETYLHLQQTSEWKHVDWLFFLRLPKAAKQNEILLHLHNIWSNTFRKHFSRHRFATFFGQYLSQLSEVHSFQYIRKIDNKQ